MGSGAPHTNPNRNNPSRHQKALWIVTFEAYNQVIWLTMTSEPMSYHDAGLLVWELSKLPHTRNCHVNEYDAETSK